MVPQAQRLFGWYATKAARRGGIARFGVRAGACPKETRLREALAAAARPSILQDHNIISIPVDTNIRPDRMRFITSGFLCGDLPAVFECHAVNHLPRDECPDLDGSGQHRSCAGCEPHALRPDCDGPGT